MVTGLMACALVGGGVVAAAPTHTQVSQRMVVDETGAHLVIDHKSASGDVYSAPGGGGFVDEVTQPRWDFDDNGELWIGSDVALGDNGAALFAGKELNAESVTMFATGSVQPVFNFDAATSESPQVAVADRAPRSAAMVVFDTDPTGEYDFEATVHAFDTTGSGAPVWSYTFPTTLNYFGGGVAVSDDGNVVLAWKADPNTETLLIEAFDWAGNPISSGSHQVVDGGNVYFHSRQTRLSDDGSRAYFNIGTSAVIYDIATASVEFEFRIGASFDAHALSGDGSRFAFGNFGYFAVWEDDGAGNWSEIARKTFTGSTFVANVALDTDGSRIGYTVQQYSPAYDHIEVGMYDVDNEADLFNTSYDAPGTAYQLSVRGVAIDDAGEYVAGCSWGDSFGTTPVAFVYDDEGNATAELGDVPGSAYTVDIDADGDVFAVGTKDVHANEFGNGGSIICADAYEYTLSVLGYPETGGTLQIIIPPVGDRARIAASNSLGADPTPFGTTEIDLDDLIRDSGFINIPPSGLTLNVNVPDNPALLGRDIHFQAGIVGGAGQGLTNKVSIRIVE